MARSGRVGMGEFIHQNQRGLAFEDRIEIHFREPMALVAQMRGGDDLETRQKGRGFPAAVGFHHARHNIHSLRAPGPACFQHLIGLAHARSSTQENLQPPAEFTPGRFEQRIGRRPDIGMGIFGHGEPSGPGTGPP